MGVCTCVAGELIVPLYSLYPNTLLCVVMQWPSNEQDANVSCKLSQFL